MLDFIDIKLFQWRFIDISFLKIVN